MAFDSRALAFESEIARAERHEARSDEVQIVEYSRFPRRSEEDGPRVGFTRDVSASGMCIGVDVPEPQGALLRVTLRDAGGRPVQLGIARVVWSGPARDGRHWLGLELVRERRGQLHRV